MIAPQPFSKARAGCQFCRKPETSAGAHPYSRCETHNCATGARAVNSTIRFFICGSALRGQPDHANLNGARFAGEARTAPCYRLHSVNDEHPAVYYVDQDGVSIDGELYELTPEQHAALLRAEPPDLYEDTILIDDGSLARAMVYPRALVEERGHPDISRHGGWAAYQRSRTKAS